MLQSRRSEQEEAISNYMLASYVTPSTRSLGIEGTRPRTMSMTTTNTASSATPTAVYLYAGDQIIENVTTGNFYFQDSLGNTSHVTDAVGNLLERYTYSAFGTPSFFSANNTQLSTSAYGIRHLFQGQLWTQETGLNDYRNRVEFPTMGVFLQPDPISFKGDAANIYRFCGNDPVDRTDPTGLDALENENADASHRYSYYLQPQLNENSLKNWTLAHMTGKTAAPYQCAGAAAVLAGTLRSDGLHRAPEATTWLRGPDVTKSTPRMGALVARGWDKDGRYLNSSNLDPKNYKDNHAGIFLGFVGKDHQQMRILDQWIVSQSKDKKSFMVMPIGSHVEATAGYARVDSSRPYEPEVLQFALKPPGPESSGDGEIGPGGSAGLRPPIQVIGAR